MKWRHLRQRTSPLVFLGVMWAVGAMSVPTTAQQSARSGRTDLPDQTYLIDTGAAVYQLGQFGTAAKLLKTWELKR